MKDLGWASSKMIYKVTSKCYQSFLKKPSSVLLLLHRLMWPLDWQPKFLVGGRSCTQRRALVKSSRLVHGSVTFPPWQWIPSRRGSTRAMHQRAMRDARRYESSTCGKTPRSLFIAIPIAVAGVAIRLSAKWRKKKRSKNFRSTSRPLHIVTDVSAVNEDTDWMNS